MQNIKNKLAVLGSLVAAGALALALVGCGGAKEGAAPVDKKDADGKVILTVGASPSPHGDILKVVQPILAKEGIDLKIKEFTDYVLPNKALADGELDANYFQHVPYLEDYNKKNGTHLVPIAKVHFESMAIYPGKSKDLKNCPEGATIAVPNDTTNEARALLLVQAQGLIKLKEGAGLDATPKDIVENPKNIKFVEVEAAVVPSALKDADFGVVNGNYALSAHLDPKTALAVEGKDSLAAKEYANVLVVDEKRKDDPNLQKLAKALTSPEVKEYIEKTYAGTVIPVF